MGHVTRMTANLPRLQTARLTLRPVERADAAPTAALVTPDVAANLSTWPSPLSVDQALAKIERAECQAAERKALDCAILDRSTGALLGWIGLAVTDGADARFGYWLGSTWRGRGLMTEAAAAFLPAAADYLGVECIIALVLKDNRPSIAVLQSAGFLPAGEEEFHFETSNQQRSCLRYVRQFRRNGVPPERRAD